MAFKNDDARFSFRKEMTENAPSTCKCSHDGGSNHWG